MKSFAGIEAVLFDLDGTLIDSAPDVAHALNQLLAEDGRPQLTLAQVQALVGEGPVPLIEGAYAATGPAIAAGAVKESIARYLAFYRACPSAHTVVYDGVEAVLAELAGRGIAMGICTNKPHQMTELVLQSLNLARFFKGVIGGDVIARRKPDGEHILETLRRMGAEPHGAVMVGDSGTDMKAGRHAGLPLVAVSYGYARMDPRALDCDILIDSFRDLPAALERLCP